MRFELNQNFSYNLLIDKFASDDAHISQSIFFFLILMNLCRIIMAGILFFFFFEEV